VDGNQIEGAFAGATVHIMFNFLSVAVLRRSRSRTLVARQRELGWSSEKMTESVSSLVINSNSDMVESIVLGVDDCEKAEDYTP
jgi:hypothetical protein